MEELSLDFDDIVNENKINIYAFVRAGQWMWYLCVGIMDNIQPWQ
jgi:hypothetical protein